MGTWHKGVGNHDDMNSNECIECEDNFVASGYNRCWNCLDIEVIQ